MGTESKSKIAVQELNILDETKNIISEDIYLEGNDNISNESKLTIKGPGDLEKMIETYVEKIDGIWTCKICGKKATSGGITDMKRHIETKHTEGANYPCNQCDKTYRLKYTLHSHIKEKHNV